MLAPTGVSDKKYFESPLTRVEPMPEEVWDVSPPFGVLSQSGAAPCAELPTDEIDVRQDCTEIEVRPEQFAATASDVPRAIDDITEREVARSPF